MDYDYNDRKQASVYSKRLKAGKRRTYFFDVRETRGNDFFLTITESRKRFNEDGYDRHKIFLYKEDFNKFQKALSEAVDHVKTELMPDYDFDSFSHEGEEQEEAQYRGAGSSSGSGPRSVSYNNDARYNSSYNSNSNSHSQNKNNELGTSGVGESAPAADQTRPAEQKVQEETDLSAIEAEPLQAKSDDSQDVTNEADATDAGEEIVNATSTSDKLASEEVEKW